MRVYLNVLMADIFVAVMSFIYVLLENIALISKTSVML